MHLMISPCLLRSLILFFRFDYFGRTSTPLHTEWVVTRPIFFIVTHPWLQDMSRNIYQLGKEWSSRETRERTNLLRRLSKVRIKLLSIIAKSSHSASDSWQTDTW